MPPVSNFCHIFGCGSEAVLLSLMQIRCSFTSVVLAGQYDRNTALTRRHKNAQKNHFLTTERRLAEWLIKGTASDT